MVRRVITIDGGETVVDSKSTIRDVLLQAGKPNAPSVVVSGEVISPSDYGRPAPPHGMTTNASDIEKGATLRQRLLDREAEMIATQFLRAFPGRRRSIELTDNTLRINDFPLPDGYRPDWVDMVIVTWGYPDVPPAGVHLPSDSPNLVQIAQRLDGHVMRDIPDGYREQVEDLAQYGWHWVCYHYRDWSWRLNPNNLLAGDCLYKYVENVFAAVSGGHR